MKHLVNKWAPRFGTFTRVTDSYETLKAGSLRVNKGFPLVSVDPRNIDWNLGEVDTEPFDHPGWRLYFHSLGWLHDLFLDARAVTDQEVKSEILQYVIDTTKDWAEHTLQMPDEQVSERWNGHCTAMRAVHLLTLRTHVDEDWLRQLLVKHGEQLERQFSGLWNHGLIESTVLYGIGQELNVPRYRDTGRTRIEACYSEMIDDQGAINEQAPTYAGYIFRLLRGARWAFEAYSDEAQTRIDSRVARLEDFIAHSLDPEKRHITLGDSSAYLTAGYPSSSVDWFARPILGGRALKDTTAVYDRGYVFSRASWENESIRENNTYLTMRFGPGRVIHGHNDHTSVTLYSYDRHTVVDSGHVGYQQTPLRRYVQSHQAHNVLEIVGRKLDHAQHTPLVAQHISNDQSKVAFRVNDAAYQDVMRTRSVALFHRGPLAVLDEAEDINSREILARQLWHLAPEFNLDSADEHKTRFISARGDVQIIIYHFNLLAPGEKGVNGFTYWRGSEDPLRGWVAVGNEVPTPAPNFGYSVQGSKVKLLTVLVPAPIEATVSMSYRATELGYDILRVHREDAYFAWNVAHESRDHKVSLSFR